MRQAPEGAPPLPKGWENLPDEYEIEWNIFSHIYHCRKDGKLHSWNDCPAVVQRNNYFSWRKNGILHRENNKPARIWENGEFEYFLNGIGYEPDWTQINITNIKDILE